MSKDLEKMMPKDIVWEERYRPRTMDELILPTKYKKQLSNEQLRNYLFVGQQGTGKTSTAYVISKKRKVKFIDCSSSRSISTIRDEISAFCAIASVDGVGKKVIILDEIDALPHLAQQALRGTIEKFKSVARFIATCNYPEKILPPVMSRFTVVNFDLQDETDRNEQVGNYARRLKHIVESNGMTFENSQVIATIIKKFYPDMRNLLQTLQDCYDRGVKIITSKDIMSASTTQYDEAFEKIISTSNPVELYKYFSAWKTKENILLNGLQSEFARHIITKHPEKADRLGEVAIVVHRYGVESKHALDLFITMLACVYDLSKTLQ